MVVVVVLGGVKTAAIREGGGGPFAWGWKIFPSLIIASSQPA